MNNNLSLRPEIMSPSFTKHHIDGLGFDAVIHQFDAAGGLDEFAHDHPFSFTSFVASGFYIERVYISDKGIFDYWIDLKRKAGKAHFVPHNCVHKIIEIAPTGCTTIITPGPKVQEPGFFDFREDGVYYRQHDHNNWTPYKS